MSNGHDAWATHWLFSNDNTPYIRVVEARQQEHLVNGRYLPPQLESSLTGCGLQHLYGLDLDRMRDWNAHEHSVHFLYNKMDFVNHDPARTLLGAVMQTLNGSINKRLPMYEMGDAGATTLVHPDLDMSPFYK